MSEDEFSASPAGGAPPAGDGRAAGNVYPDAFPKRRDLRRAEQTGSPAATGEAAPGGAATGEAAPGEAATGEAAPGEAAPRGAATGEAAPVEAARAESADPSAESIQPPALGGELTEKPVPLVAPAEVPATAIGHGFVTPGPPIAEEPQKKDYGRAGRNLPAAIGVGVLLGVVVLAPLLFYPPLFVLVTLVGIMAAMWELANALSRSGSVVARVPTMTAAACMLIATYVGGREALWVTFTVGVGAVLLFTLFEHRPNPVKDVCLSLFALTYVGLMASFVVHMLTFEQGNLLVIFFLALVVASDTGGYVFGVLWGKHPIAPQISPKKSWEGYAGSALFSTAVGIGMAWSAFDSPVWTGVVIGFVIPAVATLGDFSESMIKRDLDLKDMGTLLPGHGGVMDRLDSILPTAPIALILFTFLPGYTY